jgi:hypothetical protein
MITVISTVIVNLRSMHCRSDVFSLQYTACQLCLRIVHSRRAFLSKVARAVCGFSQIALDSVDKSHLMAQFSH